MKKTAVLLLAMLGLGTFTPLTADAAPDRHHSERRETRVTYDRHGHRVFWVKEYQGRDRRGRPIFAWVKEDRRSWAGRPGGKDYGHRGHDHRDRDYGRGERRSGFGFFFSR